MSKILKNIPRTDSIEKNSLNERFLKLKKEINIRNIKYKTDQVTLCHLLSVRSCENLILMSIDFVKYNIFIG